MLFKNFSDLNLTVSDEIIQRIQTPIKTSEGGVQSLEKLGRDD